MFPMCWTVAQIAWAMIDGKQMLKAGKFDGKTNWEWAVQTLEHALDFMFRCHLKPGSFVAQVRSGGGLEENAALSSACTPGVALQWWPHVHQDQIRLLSPLISQADFSMDLMTLVIKAHGTQRDRVVNCFLDPRARCRVGGRDRCRPQAGPEARA
jgi:hypothetical protein